MIGLVIGLAAGPVLAAAGFGLLHSGLRAGDRPGDVTVTAELGLSAQPDGCRPVVVATVRNPGAGPVLLGLSVQATRVPSWLGSGLHVCVPRRPARQQLRPVRQAVVGVAGPGTAERWLVPVPGRGRRYRLLALAGQQDRRLRVIQLPVPQHSPEPVAARQGPDIRQRHA